LPDPYRSPPPREAGIRDYQLINPGHCARTLKTRLPRTLKPLPRTSWLPPNRRKSQVTPHAAVVERPIRSAMQHEAQLSCFVRWRAGSPAAELTFGGLKGATNTL